MHRPISLLVPLFLVTFLLTGCWSGVTGVPGEGEGDLSITIPLPKGLSEMSTRSVSDQLTVSEVQVNVTQGETILSRMASINGNIATVFFSGIQSGEWFVEISAFDGDGYVIYSGNKTLTVMPSTTTSTTIELTVAPGNLNVEVTYPENIGIISGSVLLVDPFGPDLVREMILTNGVATATFESITSTSWPINVTFRNADGNIVGSGEGTVDVLPGRTTTASIDLSYATQGSLVIECSWDTHPSDPSGLLASSTSSEVELVWDPNPEENIAGYYVYKSNEVDGTKRIVTNNLVNTCSFVDQNVVDGGSYWYWVQAFSNSGLSSGLSAPANIVFKSSDIIGSLDTPGTAFDIQVVDRYAYIADYDYGLQVADVSDPSSPSLVGSIDTPDIARGICVSGDYAYVADGESGLQIIDISIPASPSIITSLSVPGVAISVKISESKAYIATTQGLVVADVSNPLMPSVLGSTDQLTSPERICINGNCVYVADRAGGLAVVDISTPSNPVVIATLATPDEAWDVCVAGIYAYVATYASGLQIIDISSPSNPMNIAQMDTDGHSLGVAISGNYVYVGDSSWGVKVIDVSNPHLPSTVKSVKLSDMARHLSISSNFVLVTDQSAGLKVLEAI